MKTKLTIAVSLLLLRSCKRERCWECTEQHPIFVTKTITCDKTKQEIKDLEALYVSMGKNLSCEVER
jgi:hypothetical protein